MIEIISATRFSEADFWGKSALGISLRRLSHDKRLVARIAFQNQLGLPSIYNSRISEAANDSILVFMHDDVWIDDYFLADHVNAGLRVYDVIGVAGNKQRAEFQPAWTFLDDKYTPADRKNLSGSVATGKNPFSAILYFVGVPAECELLDGVFIAARKSVLKEKGVSFDTRFDFNFYDLDFCRSARQNGLRLGTWPISLTHQSDGKFGSKQWIDKFYVYFDKWKS